MRFPISILTALVLAAFSAVTAQSQPCTPTPVPPFRQQSIFTQYVQAFYIDQDVDEAFKHIQDNYIQHNPFVGQGWRAAYKALGAGWPDSSITLLHSAFDKGIGYVHFKGQGGAFFPEVSAGMDIFRFNGSCIGEHWDVIQPLPKNATNPMALFGKDPVWL